MKSVVNMQEKILQLFPKCSARKKIVIRFFTFIVIRVETQKCFETHSVLIVHRISPTTPSVNQTPLCRAA